MCDREKKTMKIKNTNPFIIAVMCSLMSAVTDFIFIPNICRGWIDFVWMALMVILPVVIAVLLFRMINYRKPGYIFIGLLIQYVVLIAFAGPVSKLWGSSIEHTLGWFSYIGSVFPWPLVITLIQYVVIVIIKKSKN